MSGGGTIRSESPKAAGLSISTATAGKPIALAWGTPKLPVNVISYHDFEAIRHASSQGGGGKGGGSMENVSYTYKVGLMLGLCAGPIFAVRHVYIGKGVGMPGAYNFAVVKGDWDQQVPPELLSSPTLGGNGQLAYRGVAGLVSYKYDLGDSEALPNMTAEVDTGTGYDNKLDALPSRIMREYLAIAGIPASYLTEMNEWGQYCVAAGLFFSPAYTEREAAREAVKRLMRLTGSEIYESNGKLRVVIHADGAISGNNITWTPNLTPVADLGMDDFLDQDAPVKITCASQSDTRNVIRVKFSNRAKDYAEDYGVARDLASIQKYGEREEEIDASKEICEASVASMAAQLILNRQGIQRLSYEFKLGWKYARLERGDLITLTQENLHLNRQLARIKEISIDADGVLSYKAEEVLVGSSAPARSGAESPDGYRINHNVAPGALNPPVIFEPPLALSGSPQIWIGASGTGQWGGCDVWISDDGDTYTQSGRITLKARQGTLTTALPVGAGLDSVHALTVDMALSGSELVGGTEQNALDLLTLSYVDGELLAYRDAKLIGPNQYQLGWLVRGAYGTPIGEHLAGRALLRLDDAIGKLNYDASKIGRKILIKLQSFNVYGTGHVSLADIEPIAYHIQGAALTDVTGLALAQPFSGSSCKIKWNAVDAASSYTVEVWAGVPQTLRRTAQVGDTRQFEYSAEDGKADGGPWRTLTFRVKATSQTGSSSNWANLSASNPAPAAPTGVRATIGFGSIIVSHDPHPDSDVAGFLIYLSNTSGFTPAKENLVSDDMAQSVVLFSTADGGDFEVNKNYYLKLAAYDDFGRDQLNFSGELKITMTEVAEALTKLLKLGPESLKPGLAEALSNAQQLIGVDLAEVKNASASLGDLRDQVQQQALASLDGLLAQDAEASKRRAAAAAIVRETTTRISETSALAQDIEALSARAGKTEAGILDTKQAIADEKLAMAQSVLDLQAAFKSADAGVLQAANTHTDTAVTTATNAFSESVSSLSTQVGDQASKITSLTQSVDGVKARWSVAMTLVNGQYKVSGGVQLNGENNQVAFDVLANVFRVSLPDGSGSKPVFTTGTVDGVPTVGITGDLYLDGKLNGRAIATNTIEAGHIKTNTIEAGHIKTNAIEAGHIKTDTLKALDANLGKARNDAGTNFVNFNAAGTERFWQVGDQAFVRADGYAEFTKAKIRGDIEATSLGAISIKTESLEANCVSGTYASQGGTDASVLVPLKDGYEVLIFANSVVPQTGYMIVSRDGKELRRVLPSGGTTGSLTFTDTDKPGAGDYTYALRQDFGASVALTVFVRKR